MKHFCGLIISFSCMYQILNAQPDTLWTRTYGTEGDDVIFSIDQTTDGGFIMGGVVESLGTSDYWLIRTNPQGDTLWTRAYGGPGEDKSKSGQITFDGGYIMAGLGEMWLIKTNANGDTLWTRRSGGPGGGETPWVEQTADSGYIITGNISDEVNHAQVGLIKTDSLGNTQWTQTYGGTGDEYGRMVQQTADSGYIIVADMLIGGNTDIWLLKTDANGDTTWTSTFSPGESEANAVRQTADSGYAIFSLVRGTLAAPDSEAPRDWLLIKTDTTGNLEWSQTYGMGGDDQSMDMVCTDDGGFLLTGWLDLTDSGNSVDLWLIKTDSLGDTVWTTALGDTGMDIGIGLLQIADGEYAVAGGTGSWGAGGFEAWLVRFGEPITAVVPGPGTPNAFVLHANYPNPFNPVTTLRYNLPEAASVKLIVYDIIGRELVRLRDESDQAGYHSIVWNGRDNAGRELPSGIYIARMVTPGYNKSIKMVLLK